MFRQRTSSQKPGDDLLANFRQQFPQVAAVSTGAGAAPAISQTAGAENTVLGAPNQERGPNIDNEAFHDQDPTPRANNEQWRFTPSLLDPNSYSFSAFANAPPGYYTPTPGGTNTLFHPQAGDLHTPTLSLVQGLGTPLSMPTSGDVLHPNAAPMDIGGFQALQPHQFHHFNPFVHAPPPQPAFAPSSFVHQDTGYETMDQDGSPMDSDPSEERMTSMDSAFNTTSPLLGLQARQMPGMHVMHGLPGSAEKFRFHSTLNAPTAMIKQADEIPVTYLNKGQAYSLTVSDTNASMPIAPGTKYRTFVRISFEDEQQRQKPGVCWSLWKEGRGTNEAHQRGGKLQAVEYVEAGQPAEGDDKRTRLEVESSSFDGFSIIWTPGINGTPEVNIAVRFNFLSTDFSHSKGVKGIPVRLCAKTSTIPSDPTQPAADANPEICFCKVKLFRDHGAERKLSNDVAHVKKSIDKLKQQIAQAESGMKDFGKRKRSSGVAKAADPQRPGKAPKHKRTWSMSSTSSAGGGAGRMTMEEDLAYKLQTLQDMFTSTRPVSVLYLRGEEQDDPDLHPVSMPGDMSPQTKAEAIRDGPNWQARSERSSATGSIISPSPSSISLASQASAIGSGGHWQNFDSVSGGDVPRKGPDHPTQVKKTDDDGNLSGWIEALGVDPSYRPPLERAPKPVACFYVLYRSQDGTDKPEFHRAIYLAQRTLKELNDRIAAKWGLDSARIRNTIHVLHNGLGVEMDDDVVREMKEGQDMILEIHEPAPVPTKREWEMSVDATDDMAPSQEPARAAAGITLRLVF
ncbi:hypothetical protein S7711_02166 [Stachybotrys chartarum IBT 7711]|uniref:Grh/CP2 DB domain-containing protein n=1 Tax=Stachybotrys chartarum (strain CBS 109288 / IBT 7711) TaxID=1280523 RepID=A0A084ARN2_STACB|nr:hypothetical protein S7711_02166 [Stachybotrys chartarum IBT 7711]KFA48031.1 hypothetical protein S40293_02688 [Stachybotrys chartarum IBT 40293]